MKCQEEGCEKEGDIECKSPDTEKPEVLHYCKDHAYSNGFCFICGDFYGGIEGFDFNNPTKLCEHCLDQVKTELGEYDDDGVDTDQEDDSGYCDAYDYYGPDETEVPDEKERGK